VLYVYDILNGYSAYLQQNYTVSTLTLKQRITTVKNFLEYHDVDISPRKFKLKVKLPRVVRKNNGVYQNKSDRTVFLTEEAKEQLNSWLSYKYRTRRVCHKDEQTGKAITEIRTPEKKESDLIFAMYQSAKSPVPVNL
jgi:hypothetical protein